MSFWNKEDPILDDKGKIIKGGMWAHQREWWESKAFIKALVTGYGGGKTFIGGKKSISLSLHNAPSPHLVVSPSYKMAKKTMIPTIQALLDGKKSLLPGLTYKYNKSEHEFKINYHGRKGIIWVVSGDIPDSLKGPNVGSALIDEPFIQDREVFDQTMARIRDPLAIIQGLDLTGTPEQLNWGYDICEGEERENYDIELIQASTRENKVLDKSYADRLERGYTDKASEAYIDGKFVSLSEGLVYYGFSKDRNVVDLPDNGGELGVGMDFNVNPMAALLFWQNGDHIHFMKEIELANADTEYMCSYIKDKFRLPNGKCRARTVYPDSTGNNRSTKSPGGKTDFNYIKEAGFRIDAPHMNPLIRDRENTVNGRLNPKTGKPLVTISPRCKKLIAYLNQYSHENKHKQKNMSHLLDALGYPICRILPLKRDSIIITRLHGA